MFDKLPLKVLKEIIREYKLTTHIKMSREVDGKRKSYTKKELANELHNHLDIKDDGEIVYKSHPSMNYKYKAPESAPVRAKASARKSAPAPEPEPEPELAPARAKPLKKKKKLIIIPKKTINKDEIKRRIFKNKHDLIKLPKLRDNIVRNEYIPLLAKITENIGGNNPAKNYKKYLDLDSSDTTPVDDLFILARQKVIEENSGEIPQFKKKLTDIDNLIKETKQALEEDEKKLKKELTPEEYLDYEIQQIKEDIKLEEANDKPDENKIRNLKSKLDMLSRTF